MGKNEPQVKKKMEKREECTNLEWRGRGRYSALSIYRIAQVLICFFTI